MSEKEKKKIPKIKKTLGKMLTDESGKISKKLISGVLLTTGLAVGGGVAQNVVASETSGEGYNEVRYDKQVGEDKCKGIAKAYHVSAVSHGHVSAMPILVVTGSASFHSNHSSHSNTCYLGPVCSNKYYKINKLNKH